MVKNPRHLLEVVLPGLDRRAAPGLVVSAALLGSAFAGHQLLPVVPMLTLCVVLGAIAGNTLRPATRLSLEPGMDWGGKQLMRAGIVLLGFQLSVSDVLGLGWKGVGLIALVVAGSFGGTYLIARALKLPGDQPVLLASGFAICGASAIGAMSHARGTSKDAPVPVALVTLCGTLAIAVLPLANTWLNLNELDFGRWVGASVHDVGQVVATAQGAGFTALAAAVVVKLVRVLMLAPISVLGSLSARRRQATASDGSMPFEGERPPLVPIFVLGFIACVLLRSTGWMPDSVLHATKTGQEILLGMALVGLGFAVDLRHIFSTAGRALAAAIGSWAVVATLGLGFVALMA
ncbi:YeiH family protein [Paeniglutamicibacter sp. NPDC091659]|uniref:YeiH family protein n=1 Tax=Paeniglutamicibacter sp. NPDC091659 TaxID=3364389 RepID=UPI00382A1F90